MTTQEEMLGELGSPVEDPWAETTERGALARARATGMLQALPSELDGAGEAVAGAVKAVGETVAGAGDDSLLMGASIASGMAIGLLLGGGPRLLAAGALITAVSLGASLAQRHPGRSRSRMAGTLSD